MANSNQLRLDMKKRREQIEPNELLFRDNQLSRRLTKIKEYRDSQSIAVYWSIGGEMGLSSLIQQAWRAGKDIFLPVLDGDTLLFSSYASDSLLVKNCFGIPEPVGEGATLRSVASLDLILLPLVAFDGDGHRLGMGGGYYDRCLSFTRDVSLSARPFLMGIAHDFQRVPLITTEPWDVPVDCVLTERAVYRKNPR